MNVDNVKVNQDGSVSWTMQVQFHLPPSVWLVCSRCYSHDPCDCWGQHVEDDPYDVLGGES